MFDIEPYQYCSRNTIEEIKKRPDIFDVTEENLYGTTIYHIKHRISMQVRDLIIHPVFDSKIMKSKKSTEQNDEEFIMPRLIHNVSGITRGSKFEVYAWVLGSSCEDKEEKYQYDLRYSGESMEEALSVMFDLKESGIACIKLEWR